MHFFREPVIMKTPVFGDERCTSLDMGIWWTLVRDEPVSSEIKLVGRKGENSGCDRPPHGLPAETCLQALFYMSNYMITRVPKHWIYPCVAAGRNKSANHWTKKNPSLVKRTYVCRNFHSDERIQHTLLKLLCLFLNPGR